MGWPRFHQTRYFVIQAVYLLYWFTAAYYIAGQWFKCVLEGDVRGKLEGVALNIFVIHIFLGFEFHANFLFNYQRNTPWYSCFFLYWLIFSLIYNLAYLGVFSHLDNILSAFLLNIRNKFYCGGGYLVLLQGRVDKPDYLGHVYYMLANFIAACTRMKGIGCVWQYCVLHILQQKYIQACSWIKQR